MNTNHDELEELLAIKVPKNLKDELRKMAAQEVLSGNDPTSGMSKVARQLLDEALAARRAKVAA